MKYKIGDKVVIKRWEQLTTRGKEDIKAIVVDGVYFRPAMCKSIDKLCCGRLLTIKSVDVYQDRHHYQMKETDWVFSDGMIESKIDMVIPVKDNSIESRFEILYL